MSDPSINCPACRSLTGGRCTVHEGWAPSPDLKTITVSDRPRVIEGWGRLQALSARIAEIEAREASTRTALEELVGAVDWVAKHMDAVRDEARGLISDEYDPAGKTWGAIESDLRAALSSARRALGEK